MRFSNAIAFAGHQIHFCRYREAGTLMRWLGDDLRGQPGGARPARGERDRARQRE